jgi:hypothetical protein
MTHHKRAPGRRLVGLPPKETAQQMVRALFLGRFRNGIALRKEVVGCYFDCFRGPFDRLRQCPRARPSASAASSDRSRPHSGPYHKCALIAERSPKAAKR